MTVAELSLSILGGLWAYATLAWALLQPNHQRRTTRITFRAGRPPAAP